MSNPKIERAIVSVTDKTGVVEFVRALQDEFGTEIISTGGTAKVLADAGITVIPIETYTGFPEMMDGRVKTLHPRVHGGLLCRRDLDTHMEEAKANDIGMIDMIVVNLYDFEGVTSREDTSFETAVENIDIGGPSMLRSAAKNFASVTVVINPATYDAILEELRVNGGSTTLDTRKKLALEVFRRTSAYDTHIYQYLEQQIEGSGSFPQDKRIILEKKASLRYGENPHQEASVYTNLTVDPTDGDPSFMLARADQIQGKELSYNNYLDMDAAWAAVREFTDQPTCVIVKHLTPCGIASCDDLCEAYRRAHECDPISAYGGVMAFNGTVTADIVNATRENKQFIECIVAPEFTPEALAILAEKKAKTRVLATGGINKSGSGVEYRAIEGGMLVQGYDHVDEDPSTFTVPTKTAPTDEQMKELLFAWKACKSVKSNAIVITKDHATVGLGGGQPNRVNSARIAVEQAGDKTKGAVAASDAFMPFADSLEVLAEAGITAVIQPGGSIRDEEVIEAADKAGIAIVFTGHRHFRH